MPEPKARAELPSPIELAERLSALEERIDEKLEALEEKLLGRMYERVDREVHAVHNDHRRELLEHLREWKVTAVQDMRAEIDNALGNGVQAEEVALGAPRPHAVDLYNQFLRFNNNGFGGNNR